MVRLSAPAFSEVVAQGKCVRAGAGATLPALISQAARSGLAGLETLVGIPGTVGGALRHNSGDRSVEIGQFVSKIEVLDAAGVPQTRGRDELRFAYGTCNLDDPLFVAAEMELEFLTLIEQINRASGTTVVLVTHEEARADRIAQRKIYLADGRLVEERKQN